MFVMQRDITLWNKIRRQCLLLVGLILFAGPKALAQNYYFRHYSIENGLIQSQVIRIFQDSERYMWIGTSGGISRFDGTEFTNYTRVDGMTGDLVDAIAQGHNGVLINDEAGVSSIANGHLKNVIKLPESDWGMT